METWRIAIPIVVLVLCTICAWYVVKLRWEEIRSKMYVRDRKDFFDKFVKLLDWENEKVSANRESEKS